MTESRKWIISIEDENGDHEYLNAAYIEGTYGNVTSIAENLAEEWEARTGGLVLKLTLESHGRVNGTMAGPVW